MSETAVCHPKHIYTVYLLSTIPQIRVKGYHVMGLFCGPLEIMNVVKATGYNEQTVRVPRLKEMVYVSTQTY